MKFHKILLLLCVVGLSYQCQSTDDTPEIPEIEIPEEIPEETPEDTPEETPEEDEGMDLYLCIGQSNMAGRATIETQDEGIIPNAYLFTGNDFNGGWVSAQNPLNLYSTIRKDVSLQRLSPSYDFCKEMVSAYPNKKIGLIVNALGGSAIEEWMPGELYYNEAISQVTKASKDGVLKGVIWHQGESNGTKYYEYMAKIKVFIEALRTDLNIPDLPFVAGQLSLDRPELVYFNNMILDLPNQVENTGVVSTENTITTDDTHFDSASQRLLGKRYSEEMIKLLSTE